LWSESADFVLIFLAAFGVFFTVQEVLLTGQEPEDSDA
jgi:hypothetical protein